MPVTLRNVLNLSSAAEMKLSAGSGGLDRVLTRPVVCRNNSVPGSVCGGELLFITGAGLWADASMLKSLISEASIQNLAGIVFEDSNEYNPVIDKSIIDFADILSLPIFRIVPEAKLLEIVKDMTEFIIERQNEDKMLRTLMEKVLFSLPDEMEGLKKRITNLGYNDSAAYQTAIIRIMRPRCTILDDARCKEYVHLFARNLLSQRFRGVMSMSRSDDIVLFAPVCRNKDIYTELSCVSDEITKRFTGTQASTGIGNSAKSLSGLRRSLCEAESALNERINNVATAPELFSIFKDAFNYKEIEMFCDKNIGKLIDYDKLNGTELVRTVEVYFENKFNLTRTAKELMIHRNSLMYRLRRVEEIIGRKLDDPNAFLDIINSIFIKKAILSVHRATG